MGWLAQENNDNCKDKIQKVSRKNISKAQTCYHAEITCYEFNSDGQFEKHFNLAIATTITSVE